MNYTSLAGGDNCCTNPQPVCAALAGYVRALAALPPAAAIRTTLRRLGGLTVTLSEVEGSSPRFLDYVPCGTSLEMTKQRLCFLNPQP